MKTFLCSGTKGDVIMSLYIVKAMGGGDLLIAPGEFEEAQLEGVLESCGKLVTSQPYVRSFRIHAGEPIDISLDLFRKSPGLYRTTLLEVMCRAQGLRLPTPVGPWMEIPPHPDFAGKIVIHRRISKVPERANPLFDWDRLLKNFGPENFVFVSRLEYEWHEFGHPEVAYYRPADMYEHAQAIRACRFFVGNQSLPSALADALGVDRIFELSIGIDRKHFAVTYANNAWYFASPWDSTVKNFRFVRQREKRGYRDLVTGDEVVVVPEDYRFDRQKALIQELGFWAGYWKFCGKRFLKFALGVGQI
jgi:hypothetical protein